MVHITDDGVFDAPIDKLWKYVNDDMLHRHGSFRVSKILEQKGNSVVMETDVENPGGTGTHKETLKMVMNPPKGFDAEYLTGPMKGSRHTHTYTPMGNRTRVDVVGDFTIQGLGEVQTRQAVLDYLARVFEEDNAALKRMK